MDLTSESEKGNNTEKKRSNKAKETGLDLEIDKTSDREISETIDILITTMESSVQLSDKEYVGGKRNKEVNTRMNATTRLT